MLYIYNASFLLLFPPAIIFMLLCQSSFFSLWIFMPFCCVCGSEHNKIMAIWVIIDISYSYFLRYRLSSKSRWCRSCYVSQDDHKLIVTLPLQIPKRLDLISYAEKLFNFSTLRQQSIANCGLRQQFSSLSFREYNLSMENSSRARLSSNIWGRMLSSLFWHHQLFLNLAAASQPLCSSHIHLSSVSVSLHSEERIFDIVVKAYPFFLCHIDTS